MLSCGREKKSVSPQSNDPKLRKLKLPPGFVAERLYSPGEHEQGSWVAMTFDNKNRLIASDQFGGLYRMTVPPIGDSSEPTVEKLPIGDAADTSSKMRMGFSQGLLYAFNSLYVMVNHDSDDRFEKPGSRYHHRCNGARGACNGKNAGRDARTRSAGADHQGEL